MTPSPSLARVEIMERGAIRSRRVVARVAGLSGRIAERELAVIDIATAYLAPLVEDIFTVTL